MKPKNVIIFIPKNFSSNKSGFIEGFYKDYEDFEAYYITNCEILSQCKNHIGYTGKFLTSDFLARKTVFIELGTRDIQINHGSKEQLYITEIFYDYDAFQCSNVVHEYDKHYGVHIAELTKKLKQKQTKKHINGNKPGALYWMVLLVNLMITVKYILCRNILKI